MLGPSPALGEARRPRALGGGTDRQPVLLAGADGSGAGREDKLPARPDSSADHCTAALHARTTTSLPCLRLFAVTCALPKQLQPLAARHTPVCPPNSRIALVPSLSHAPRHRQLACAQLLDPNTHTQLSSAPAGLSSQWVSARPPFSRCPDRQACAGDFAVTSCHCRRLPFPHHFSHSRALLWPHHRPLFSIALLTPS